jgi:type VI secretion system secreted protein VgrG
MPSDIQFRPQRRAAMPRFDGLLSGRVEGPVTNQPRLDDQGRYRVRIPFDLSSTAEGDGSRWVRMATPFGGDGDGMHFPLFPGTEVVLGCENGDPDRPVILGAVSNPRNENVVTSEDPLSNRILFRSGMGLEAFGGAVGSPTSANVGAEGTGNGALPMLNAFEANSFGESRPVPVPDAFATGLNRPAHGNTARLWTTSSSPSASDTNGGPPTGTQWLRLGQQADFEPPSATTPVSEGANAASGFDLATSGVGRLWAADDLYLMRNGGGNGEPDRFISIDDTQILAAHDQAITIGEASGGAGYPSAITVNAQDITLNAQGSVTTNQAQVQSNVGSAGSIAITEGDTSTMVLGDSNNLYFGLYLAIYGGAYIAIYIGPLIVNINIGLTLDIKVAAGISIAAGVTLNIGSAQAYEISGGGVVKVKSTDTLISEAKTEVIADMTAHVTPMFDMIADLQTNISDIKQDVSNMHSSMTDTKFEILEQSMRILTLEVNL